ncbi:MAG: N-acetyltransferase [Methanotrichaceae archaeon]|nr:N-acetyltransferase [Methanotrichaceae archaeon]
MTFWAHPTAVIESADIGEGTRIWHYAHIREGARIGKGCNIGKGVYIDSGVVIGDGVKIQNFVSVYRGVVIEDQVFVGPSVTFTNDLHPRAFIWDEDKVVPTLVERGASIGANSTVVCGCTIGEYAMVGAGSVVTKDVPPFALVMGCPAAQRGSVCYCGKRLEGPTDAGKSTFRCADCGREVSIG